MRRMWLATVAAFAASAIVGVLLGAYVHEIRARSQDPPEPATTTVTTTVTTVTVVVTQRQAAEGTGRQVAVRDNTGRAPLPPNQHSKGTPRVPGGPPAMTSVTTTTAAAATTDPKHTTTGRPLPHGKSPLMTGACRVGHQRLPASCTPRGER